MPRAFSGPAAIPATMGMERRSSRVTARNALVHDSCAPPGREGRRSGRRRRHGPAASNSAARRADRRARPAAPRGADAGRADADHGHVGPLGRVQRVGDGLLAQQQGERLGRAEQGRGVQVAVAGPDALGQLPDQLLAGDGRVEGREAADQLDDLDVTAGEVDGPYHRLEAVAPGQRHHLAVAQRLVQPVGGQAADPGGHLGVGADLEDPGVGQPVAVAQGPLELVVALGRGDDPDLDDAEVAGLPDHAGHVRAGRPQDGGDVVLGAVVHVVEAGRLGQ